MVLDEWSAKDVQRRWPGSFREGMRYHAFAVPLETLASMAARAKDWTWMESHSASIHKIVRCEATTGFADNKD